MPTDATHEQITRVFEQESRIVIAALLATLCDIELAEDALQDALVDALQQWPKRGIPNKPGAWLMTTARRKVIDRLRRAETAQKHLPTLGALRTFERQVEQEAQMSLAETQPIPDERLKLIFTCCHPALAQEAQVALTLQTVVGLPTDVIARTFLVPKTTMAQRLVRTKRKIRDAGIPYEVPTVDKLDERLDAVLTVIYLIFNAGYTTPISDDLIAVDLCEEAIHLGETLHRLLPTEHPEMMGLLALMRLHHARHRTRTAPDGSLILLEKQNRTQWDHEAINRAVEMLDQAMRHRKRGPFQIQAAIAALHATASTFETTDWTQIALLYHALMDFSPSPVVALNHAVSVAFSDSIGAGLQRLDELAQNREMADYYLFHAARADLLRRIGDYTEAQTAYRRALTLCGNAVERRFLEKQLVAVSGEDPANDER
ncbi:MAG: RNA polymerase sigma factor [Chloroflexota bacterium]